MRSQKHRDFLSIALIKTADGQPTLSCCRGGGRRLLAWGLLTIALGFTVAGCGRVSSTAAQQGENQNGGNEPAGAPREVSTARVKEIVVGRTVVANGTLAADDQVIVGVKVPGRLRSISVDLGTLVSSGQVIAQVDPTDYQLAVEQAASALAQARVLVGLSPDGTDELVDIDSTGAVSNARATLEEARANRDRALTLVGEGVIARSEFDTSNATFLRAQSALQDAREQIRSRIGLVRQRRSELALARQQLADTVVRSPTNGVVQERQASVGEFLAASAPVATIVRMNPLRLRAEIPERDAPIVRAGQRVNVTVEGDGAVYSGHVVRLSPTISEQNRILIVEAEITNPGNLRPGSFARAEIVVDDSAKASTVPPSAVVTFAGLEKVIVVEGGKAVEKVVTTGRRTGEWIEIVTGLNVGESVVVEPGTLQQGQAVNVTRQE